MVLTRFSNRVFRLGYSLETYRPALGYVRGTDMAILIDAGNSGRHISEFLMEINKAGFNPPGLCVITHAHWDHICGSYNLRIPLVSSGVTADSVHKMTSLTFDSEAVIQRIKNKEEAAFCLDAIQKESVNGYGMKCRDINITFEGRQTLELGGLNCDIFEVDNPHSADGSMILVREEGILFGGDSCSGDYVLKNGEYDYRRLVNFIEVLKETDFDLFLHSHMDPMSKKSILRMMEHELKKVKQNKQVTY